MKLSYQTQIALETWIMVIFTTVVYGFCLFITTYDWVYRGGSGILLLLILALSILGMMFNVLQVYRLHRHLNRLNRVMADLDAIDQALNPKESARDIGEERSS